MKTKLCIFTLFLSLCFAVLLSSCGSVDESGTCTVLIGRTLDEAAVYTVKLDDLEGARSASDVLAYLNKKEGIAYRLNGTMIEEVGDLTNDGAAGDYISIWTSVEADRATEPSFWDPPEQIYEGKVLGSSAVGITQMSVPDGCILFFGIMHYDY